MISRSLRFQDIFLKQLQIDLTAFSNSKEIELEKNEHLGFCKAEVSNDIERSPFSCRWPKTFGAIVGNEAILVKLSEFLAHQLIPRVIIFSGQRGIGKTSTAQIFSRKSSCDYFDFNSPTCDGCA